MTQSTKIAFVVSFLITASGKGINLALNKRAFMSPDATQSDSGKTVDGDSATFGKFEQWLVIDLEKDYHIDQVEIQYLSWGGGGYVTVEFFPSNPAVFPGSHFTPKLCETHYCLAGDQLRTKIFTCQDQPRGRFIKIRRHNQDHPYFRVHQVTATGSELGAQECLSWLKKMEGEKMETTLAPTVFPTTSVLACASKCSQQTGCEAANFNRVTGDCEMLRSSWNDTHSSLADWSLVFFIYH